MIDIYPLNKSVQYLELCKLIVFIDFFVKSILTLGVFGRKFNYFGSILFSRSVSCTPFNPYGHTWSIWRARDESYKTHGACGGAFIYLRNPPYNVAPKAEGRLSIFLQYSVLLDLLSSVLLLLLTVLYWFLLRHSAQFYFLTFSSILLLLSQASSSYVL